MHSALLVIVLAVPIALVVAAKLNARRRYSRLKLSGGRKALALNLLDRS